MIVLLEIFLFESLVVARLLLPCAVLRRAQKLLQPQTGLTERACRIRC